MKFKKAMIYVLAFILILCLTACGSGISNRKLQKILKENGYNYETAEVEAVLDLCGDIKGLDDNGKNKLVLVNYGSYYAMVVINTKTEIIANPTFGFVPLNVIQQAIWTMDKDTNIKNVNILKKYIEQYGINGLEEKEYAEDFLRDITRKSGFFDTEAARDIISNSTTQIFPDIDSSDDVTILFEDGNAVPIYYMVAETEIAYNWNGIFPENVYNIWKASTDTRTQQTMMALYGQPYVMQTVLAGYDKDLNKLGTYDSVDAARNKLLANKSKGTKASKSGTTIVYQVKSADKETNDLDIAKEMIAAKLNNMGYENVQINLKDSDKIEVVLPTQNNIEDFAKNLIGNSNLKFTDYNDNILLTGADIQKVSAEQNTDNDSYYITLEFTEDGKSKFKKATSDISKISPPNNRMNIILGESAIFSPTIEQEVNSGFCRIFGNFSQEEAKDLTSRINYSIHKPNVKILETR